LRCTKNIEILKIFPISTPKRFIFVPGGAILRAEFCLIPTEFNDFLFAAIGDEGTGTQLTVLSALTRLGVDPWSESARLSGLPKSRAAQALAPMIARLPKGSWDPGEIPAIAARLVALLAVPGAASQPARPAVVGTRRRRFRTAVGVMVFILAASVLLGILATG
jgi:hypothetical protein